MRKKAMNKRWLNLKYRKSPESVRRKKADNVEANEETPLFFSYPASYSTCLSKEIASNDGFISENGIETAFGMGKSPRAKVVVETDSLSDVHHQGMSRVRGRGETVESKNGSQEEIVSLSEVDAAKTDSFSKGKKGGFLRARVEMIDHENINQKEANERFEADTYVTNSFSESQRGFLRNRIETADPNNRNTKRMDGLSGEAAISETRPGYEGQQRGFLRVRALTVDHRNESQKVMDLFSKTIVAEENSLFEDQKRSFSCDKVDNILKMNIECKQWRPDVYVQQSIQKDKKAFLCEICGGMFATLSYLTQHLNAHTGQLTYECEFCKKVFRWSKSLKDHLKIHTGEKPNECQLCNRTFITSSALKTHMVTHTGDKNHECLICNKRFSRKDTLIKHMLVHTCEPAFKCKVCNNAFSRKENFVSHMRLHSGVKAFECQLCHKTFAQSAGLSMHKKMHRTKSSKAK